MPRVKWRGIKLISYNRDEAMKQNMQLQNQINAENDNVVGLMKNLPGRK